MIAKLGMEEIEAKKTENGYERMTNRKIYGTYKERLIDKSKMLENSTRNGASKLTPTKQSFFRKNIKSKPT